MLLNPSELRELLVRVKNLLWRIAAAPRKTAAVGTAVEAEDESVSSFWWVDVWYPSSCFLSKNGEPKLAD